MSAADAPNPTLKPWLMMLIWFTLGCSPVLGTTQYRSQTVTHFRISAHHCEWRAETALQTSPVW